MPNYQIAQGTVGRLPTCEVGVAKVYEREGVVGAYIDVLTHDGGRNVQPNDTFDAGGWRYRITRIELPRVPMTVATKSPERGQVYLSGEPILEEPRR